MQLFSAAPLFISTDFDRTLSFYALFGFAEIARYAQGYLILRRDGVELHFSLASESHDPASSTSAAYIRFINVQSLQSAFENIGLPEDGVPRYVRPSERAWGMIEAHSVDHDGNLLIYGAAIEKLKSAGDYRHARHNGP